MDDRDRWSNPCRFGWTEYDGSRWCGEHGGAVEAGSPPGTVCSVLRRRCEQIGTGRGSLTK